MKNNRHTLRALALLLGYPDAKLRGLLPELADAIDAEAALPAARRAELRAFIGEMERADPIDAGGALRRAVRPRPRHLAAPVRARARRLARSRPGHDRPDADLREGRPASSARTSCPTTCAWCWSSPPPSRRRLAREFLGEMAPHPQRHLQRAAQAREPLRQRAGRRAGTGRPEGRGRARRRRRADRRELGRAGRLRRLLRQGPGRARRTATHPHRPQDPSRPQGARA